MKYSFYQLKNEGFRLIIFLVLFLVCFVLVNSKNCTTDYCTTEYCTSENCFSASPETCENINEPTCFLSTTHKNAAVCCRLNDDNLANLTTNNTYFSGIEYLHILNSDFTNITISTNGWPKTLKSLAITNGRMDRFALKGDVLKMSKLACLNLSSNSLTNMAKLKYSGQLRCMDLSNNSFQNIPQQLPTTKLEIDLSDNPLTCDNIIALKPTKPDNITASKSPKTNNIIALKVPKNLEFINLDNTWCILSNKQGWIVHTGRLMLSELEKLSDMEKNCSLSVEGCTCGVLRVDTSNVNAGKFLITVNCSNKNLTKLPVPLPENCFSLDVSHNNISSLKLIHDPSYDSLSHLYAHHNNITSIDDLEGSKFLHHFTRLDLRYNNITSISTHAFRYAFDRASHRELSLGHNYVDCDCNVAKNLKTWLLFNDIKDNEEVFCLGKNKVKVIQLDPSELCREDPSLIDNVYYIIVAEILLLASLIAKVTYDYRVFKGTGRLPWPASKMPKLPCDWLCE